jgi:predicted amidohydrolase
MTFSSGFVASSDDILFAESFGALNLLLKHCASREKAAVLLSSCRNNYLTANALFSELQILLGDAIELSALRAGCELLIKGAEPSTVKDRFGRARRTVHEYELKRSVWFDRTLIWAEIQQAKMEIGKTNPLAPDRIDLILKNTRISNESKNVGWDQEVLEIDLDERAHLAPVFENLEAVFSILDSAASLGWNTAIAIDRTAQARLSFGENEVDVDIPVAAENVLKHLRTLATACDWTISESEASFSIRLGGGYGRPQNSSQVSALNFPIEVSPDTLTNCAPDIGRLIREALYVAHFRMCQDFRPNVARPPMPEPFVIELPSQVAPQDRSSVLPIAVKRVRCSNRQVAGDVVRVAVARLAVPTSEMTLRDYRIKDDSKKEITRSIHLAIEAAVDAKCQAIVFPEYSLPSSIVDEIRTLADNHGIVIIGGLEGSFLNGKLCDEALVAIPKEIRLHRQRKQEPSLEEENAEGFFRDNEIKLFTGSSIGDFAVIICSDFMQLSVSQAWHSDAPLPDILFVVARNTFDAVYVDFAKADAFRLYTCVVIANVCDFKEGEASSDGVCAIVPHKAEMFLAGKEYAASGKFLNGVVAYDVPLRAIRARSRGKPENGYFAVPKSAQRN